MEDSVTITFPELSELTEIGIENFKSFGPRQSVKFKRVNFLFGPNSHGKTSVIAAINLLLSKYLHRDFTRGSIQYVDNSPSFDLSEELINRKSGSNAYTLDIRRKVISKNVYKNEILHRFYLNPDKKSNLQKYQAFEITENGNELIVEVENDDFILNSNSSFLKEFGSRIINQLDLNKSGLVNLKEEDSEMYMLRLRATYKPPMEFRDEIDLDNEIIIFHDEDKFSIADFEKTTGKNVMFANLLLARLFNINTGDTINPILFYYGWVEKFAYIGPNRRVPHESYSFVDTKEFLSKSLLNENTVNEFNEWLRTSKHFDFSYEFVLNKGNKNETSFERFPVQTIIEYGVREGLGQKMLKFSEVGSGIGHIFQILLPMFSGVKVLIIQQPEIHLHPSMQVQLARALFELSREKNIQLVIETHSEHFIKAAQLEVAKSNTEKNPVLTKDDLNVIYVSKNEDGFSQVRQIGVDKTGAFTEPWPDDFFELSGDMSLERLRLSYQKRN